MNFKHFRNLCVAFIVLGFMACQDDSVNAPVIPDEVITKIENMGFNPDGIEAVEEGYRIERDIIITHELLENAPTEHQVPTAEQYRTTNLVTTNGGRNIVIYAPVTGGKGYSPGMIAGLDLAIARYNAENLDITFSRTTNRRNNDIKMTRLSKRDENRGVLGSAGFPTNGNPYNEIKMSGILESAYGLSTEGIATIIAHEIGHCVGFRHTDFFDRSISCGGGTSNEGQAGVGAIHIPGTPDNNDLNDTDYNCNDGNGCSFMLSCTDGSDRPFTSSDVVALNFLY